jgi:transposase
MNTRKQNSVEEKSMIIALFKLRNSNNKISKITGIPRSTVGYIVREWKKKKNLHRSWGSCRKRLLKKEDIAIIFEEIGKNPKIGTPKITEKLKREKNIEVTPQTTRNYLRDEGYKAQSACEKPLLSIKNKIHRYKIAKKWIYWSEKEWQSIIFSDEAKFNVFQSDGKCTVWRKNGTRLNQEHIVQTVKHGGGNVMAWGSISANGLGELVFIEGTMDRYVYLGIVRDNLPRSAEKMGYIKYKFQQDNDPKHTATLVKDYFVEKGVDLIEWSSQSPDLNPIEHVWSYIKTKLRDYKIRNKSDLKAAIMDIWNRIPLEFVQKLINSMPRRAAELHKARGGHIDY